MGRKHLVAAALAVAAAGVAAGLAGAGGTAAKKPVALLHIDAKVACAQAAGCEILPPWMRRLENPMDVVVFADRTVYYRARVVADGRQGPRRCDKTLFDKPFSGHCVVSDFGVGLLRKTTCAGPGWKGDDVWVASETALIGSNPALQVNPFGTYPIDTCNPSVPAHYTIDELVDGKDVHPGESLTIDVTRTPLR